MKKRWMLSLFIPLLLFSCQKQEITVKSIETLNDTIDYVSKQLTQCEITGLSESASTAINEAINTWQQDAFDEMVALAYEFQIQRQANNELDVVDVVGNFELLGQTEELLSIKIFAFTNTYAFNYKEKIFNINLKKEDFINLKQFVGEDYCEILNPYIQNEINRLSKDNETMFFHDENAFKTVDELTPFYVTSDDILVIRFPKYSIGPGSSGYVEFTINRTL